MCLNELHFVFIFIAICFIQMVRPERLHLLLINKVDIHKQITVKLYLKHGGLFKHIWAVRIL